MLVKIPTLVPGPALAPSLMHCCPHSRIFDQPEDIEINAISHRYGNITAYHLEIIPDYHIVGPGDCSGLVELSCLPLLGTEVEARQRQSASSRPSLE